MTKRALKDPATGLFPNEEAFARACLKHNQSDAYRLTHSPEVVKRLKPEEINKRASDLANKPAVQRRVRALLDESKIQDLESIGHAFSELLTDLTAARTAKNWTAVAAFQRLKLQVLGMLKEIVMLSPEQTLSDEEIIKRLAGNNPALRAALAAKIGTEDRFDA